MDITQKRPALVSVITLLMAIIGILGVPASLLAGALVGGLGALLPLLLSLATIIVAFEMRKMKKWSLYGFTILAISQLIVPFIHHQYQGDYTIYYIVGDLIIIGCLIYLWAIKDKFSN